MIQAQLPSGDILEFPDGTADAVIDATVKKHLGAAPRGAGQDFAEAVGSGVIQGGADIAGLPGNMDTAGRRVAERNLKDFSIVDRLAAIVPGYRQALESRFPWLARGELGESPLPTSQDVMGAVEGAAGPLPKPETTAGRYAERAARWGTGAAGIGPRKLLGVVTGAAGGGAAEAAKDAGLPPLAQEAIGMGTMLAAGIPAAMRSTPGTMVREATRDMTPDDWATAIARQRAAEREGVPLLAPQATDSAGLQGLAADVMASRGGAGRMAGALKAQERAGTRVARERIDELAAATTPDRMAGRADDAATAVLREAERYRTAQSQPHYQRAAQEAIRPRDAQNIVAQIDLALQQVAPNGPTARALRQLRAGMFDENDQLITNVGRLDSLRKDWRDRIELPPVAAEAINKETAALINPILADLRGRMVNASGAYEAGLRAYQWNTPAVEAIANSKVGKLVGTRDPEQVVAAFTDPKRVRPSDVRELSLRLNAVDRQAFPQMVRTHVENALNDALKRRRGDAPIPMSDFAKAVRGGEGQVQRGNWDAMLEGVAQANRMDPTGLRRGWDNLLAILDRTDRIPGTGSQTAVRQQAQEMAGRGASQAALATVNITQGSVVGYLQRINRDYLQRGNFEQLARLFTDPDGVRRLRDLSLVAPNTAKAQMMAAQLLGFERATIGEE